jgi:phosphatidate cytidylyltransferase
MLRLRVLSFVFGLPLMLAVSYAGGWWLFGVVAVLAALALEEWRRAVTLTASHPDYRLSGTLVFLLLLGVQLYAPREPELNNFLVGLLTLAVGASFVSRIFRKGGTSALSDIGATLLPVLYVGLLFSFTLRLRAVSWDLTPQQLGNWPLPSGFYVLVLLFFTCWGIDTSAYLCGRHIGGPKLCPGVSPDKTIAGLIGGMAAASLLMTLGFWWGHLPAALGAVFGPLMALVSQLGDFSKSLIKREVGLKDFGSIIPGHGGVLDRFDGFLFTAPLLFYFLRWLL